MADSMNWLEWQPPIIGNSPENQPTKPTKPPLIIENFREHEPTKPTEPSSDGFEGFISEKFPKVGSDPEDCWEWIEERAGILEIDGAMDRNTANYRAFMMWFERFVGGSEVKR